MKNINIILAALAVAAASSCSYEEHNVTPEAEGSRPADVLVPLSLSTSEMTKTSLDGASVKWTADDHIAVYDNVGYANDFQATSVDGSSAVFEGFVGEGTTDFYAVYPYSGAKGIDASNITVTLPSAQTSAAGTFAEEHNISVAHGVKTQGEETVEGIKFDNVCGLIQFTVPQRISAVKSVSFKAENRALAGDLSISRSELKVVSVTNGSNTVDMTGSFAAGSTFYFVVAPGEVNGFSITVTTQNGATYAKKSTKSFTVEAAAMKNLGVIDFKAEPSAVAEHTYSDGILTGTKVTLNPGLPAGMEGYVENLTASMTRNGVEYRKLSKSSASASEVMTVVNGTTYIPQGAYTIEYTYTLNGVAETKSVNVTVPAPTFTVSASAYTSYSKYLEGTDASIAAANACTAESMYDIKLSVGISQFVLNICPMTSNKGTVYNEDGSEYVSVSDQSLSSSTFYSLAELTDIPWGAYTIDAQVTFDGVTVTSPKQTLHITGLPYTAAPPTNTGSHPWTEDQYANGVSNFKWNNSEFYMYDDTGVGNYLKVGTPVFHIPNDVPVSILTSAHGCRHALVNSDVDCRIYSGSSTADFTAKYNSGNYSNYPVNTLTLYPNPAKLQFENREHTAYCKLYINSVSISYRK